MVSLLLCVAGLADATYLTFEHYTQSASLLCSDKGTINCLAVTTSSYSDFHGAPVALLGLLYFVGMTALCLPVAWRLPALRWVRMIGATTGVLFVFYLVWAELFRINAICLWCSGVHVITILLFGVVLFATVMAQPSAAESPGADD